MAKKPTPKPSKPAPAPKPRAAAKPAKAPQPPQAEPDSTAADDAVQHAAAAKAAATTPRVVKRDIVLALLRRMDGATAADICAATGWLPHTTRAFISTLAKRGATIESTKQGRGAGSTTAWRLLGAEGSTDA